MADMSSNRSLSDLSTIKRSEQLIDAYILVKVQLILSTIYNLGNGATYSV